jgi:hypothetical protein
MTSRRLNAHRSTIDPLCMASAARATLGAKSCVKNPPELRTCALGHERSHDPSDGLPGDARVHLIPVLLGKGIRFFDHLGT